MNEKQTLKQVLAELSLLEKILLIAQTVLSLAILIVIILSLNHVANPYTMKCIAMALLVFLMIVQGIKSFKRAKTTAILSFLMALCVAVVLIRALI